MRLALCIDLDGTLIHGDITNLACWKYVRENFFRIFLVIAWLFQGRAYFKHKLAERVDIDPAELRCNIRFLSFLEKEKLDGREIFLATGCNERYARLMASYFGLFSEVFASDESTNFTGEAKAKKLVEKFGDHNFVYAGNSSSDVAVWKKSAEAILVNPTIGALIGMCRKKYTLFK